MRIATLALAVAAACHGGFFSVGGAGNLPGESKAGQLGWEGSFAGGGYLNLPESRVRAGLEGFGAYADTDVDHFYFGGGVRVNFLQRDSGHWYFRGGFDYHNLQGHPAEGPGLYAGVGRAFWLDKGHRFSLAPEVRAHAWEDIEDARVLAVPIVDAFQDDLGSVVHVVFGLQFTYHFGGRKAASKKKEERPHPDDRYYK